MTNTDVTVTVYETLDEDIGVAWDDNCRRLVVSPFQDRVGAAIRAKAFGQSIRYAVGRRHGSVVFGAAISFRSVRMLPDRLTITRGPWAIDNETLIQGTSALCQAWSYRYGTPLLLHIDPAQPQTATAVRDAFVAQGFHRAPVANFHPRSLQIDLRQSEADLWVSFRKRTHGMLKKAERDGLQSWFGSSTDVPVYAALHAAAAHQKHYGLADEPWMHQALNAGRARLVLTRDQDEIIGGAFVLLGPATLYYMYGATKPGYKGPASYHAIWHLLRWAREAGMAQCDLGALPEDQEGIVLFKRGFGGVEHMAMPEMERVFRPTAYGFLRAVQALRR